MVDLSLVDYIIPQSTEESWHMRSSFSRDFLDVLASKCRCDGRQELLPVEAWCGQWCMKWGLLRVQLVHAFRESERGSHLPCQLFGIF